jgi:hypothetical protein
MGHWLSERLGQSVIVDNKPGPGTNIGTEAVVRAPADGYTLLLIAPTAAINTTLYDRLGFDFIHDIAPVAGIMSVPQVMEVGPAVSAKSGSEFMAYAKANPGKINMASAGNGTSCPHGGRTVRDDDRHRYDPRPLPRVGAGARGSNREAGAGHVRCPALIHHADQGRQATPAGGDHGEALRRIARYSHCRRFRAGLRGKRMVWARRT